VAKFLQLACDDVPPAPENSWEVSGLPYHRNYRQLPILQLLANKEVLAHGIELKAC